MQESPTPFCHDPPLDPSHLILFLSTQEKQMTAVFSFSGSCIVCALKSRTYCIYMYLRICRIVNRKFHI